MLFFVGVKTENYTAPTPRCPKKKKKGLDCVNNIKYIIRIHSHTKVSVATFISVHDGEFLFLYETRFYLFCMISHTDSPVQMYT